MGADLQLNGHPEKKPNNKKTKKQQNLFAGSLFQTFTNVFDIFVKFSQEVQYQNSPPTFSGKVISETNTQSPCRNTVIYADVFYYDRISLAVKSKAEN